MRNSRYILVLFWLLIPALTGIGNDNKSISLTDWGYRKKIEFTDTASFGCFFLDQDIYKYSMNNLSDLRIVGNDSVFIPFFLGDDYLEEEEDYTVYKTNLINVKNDKKGNSYFDFQVVETKNKYEVNIFNLEIEAGNFSNQIEIYGRTESSGWKLIERTSIYKFPGVHKKEVWLGSMINYRFIRVKVIENTKNITISRLEAISSFRIEKQQKYLRKTNLDFEIKNSDRETKIIIQNPYRLRVRELILQANDKFNRDYYLYTDTTKYFTSKGKIYNFQHNKVKMSSFSIPVSGYQYNTKDYLMVNIINNDDQPIEITGIIASFVVDKVIF